MKEADVIVVGAGPAGCAAAYDLCAGGMRVLLLDRKPFPRPKACAGGLTVKALRALRYGIRPVIRRYVREVRIDTGKRKGRMLNHTRTVCALTVRSELDNYCLEKTIGRGAVFRVSEQIRSLHRTGDKMVMKTSSDTLRATWVIGADGVNSRIRRLSGCFPGFFKGTALETNLPAKASRPPPMTFTFGAVPGGYGWVFPKNDHINIGIYSSNGATGLNRARLEQYVHSRMEDFKGRLKVVGHPLGMGGWRYRPMHPTVLLAGDAAGMADPLMGEGLYNAIRSGQHAAAAILSADDTGATKGSAAGRYDRRLKEIRRDLIVCHRLSRCFYLRPEAGCRLLALPPVRRMLMRGYAGGLTVSHIWRHSLRLLMDNYPIAADERRKQPNGIHLLDNFQIRR